MKLFSTYRLFVCLFLLVASFSMVSSCKKDGFITSPNAQLGTSADTIKFDTVFTSVGSITQSFRINNYNDQKLLLSNIRLMGGSNSPYLININGNPVREINNIEIAPNDSIYVFVSVTINPTLDNLPFIVKDSIGISFNGNNRYVQLEAFGQNANFLRNRVITGNTTWNNHLPYVILDRLRIDTNATLTLEPGCRVYCRSNAPILVDGTLICNGTKDQPVIFRGDRLDNDYKDLPASWPGIYFRGSSKNNMLQFTEVKNAYQAIVAESMPDNSAPKLTLHQCIVDNAYDAGILSVNSSIDADNSLISNCGSNISVILGGEYHFTNCTVASYPTFISHKNPVLAANNFALLNGSPITTSVNAVFTNCIFWGEGGLTEEEVKFEKQGSDPFNIVLNNCLYKSTTQPANCTLNSCIANQSPLFDSIVPAKNIFNFRINNAAAPGTDKGIITSFLKDLDNMPRLSGSATDIGCYEKQ